MLSGWLFLLIWVSGSFMISSGRIELIRGYLSNVPPALNFGLMAPMPFMQCMSFEPTFENNK